jgi:hypothetical protein
MAQKFYVGDYGGPLTVNVFAADGETLLLPQSATIDIYNMETGNLVVDDGVCLVASGSASYVIPEGSPATDTSGRYVGYISVLIETGNKQTEEVYYNVYEKTSYLIIERWRAKVEDSTLTPDHIDDDKAREWIDQAVGWINKRYESGYTSVLAAITPVATDSDMEFIAYVASVLARRAWYAGRGSYRDDEISYDARALKAEYDDLEKYFVDINTSGLYGILDDSTVTNRNRDGVFYRGLWYEDKFPLSNPYYDSFTGY